MKAEMLTYGEVSTSTTPCNTRVMFIGRIRFDGKRNRQNLYVIWSLLPTGLDVKEKKNVTRRPS